MSGIHDQQISITIVDITRKKIEEHVSTATKNIKTQITWRCGDKQLIGKAIHTHNPHHPHPLPHPLQSLLPLH